jgi:hypothetical protein
MNRLLIIIVCWIGASVNSQVGIGTNNPNQATMLNLTSTNKRMSIPQLTSSRTDLASLVDGIRETKYTNDVINNDIIRASSITPLSTNKTAGDISTLSTSSTLPAEIFMQAIQLPTKQW